MSMWNPWRGCKKCSDGCLHCYIHKGDFKRGVDTSQIVKTGEFYKPRERYKNGNFKIKSGVDAAGLTGTAGPGTARPVVYTGFATDFLIAEADEWRPECWQMMKERPDLNFLFLTKRIDRFIKCMPEDWGDGYENVVVGCTIENQRNADYKLAIFRDLPIKHKCITAQPLIGPVDLEKYLTDVELVVVGGESDYAARELNYDWVLDIREQCMRQGVDFQFRQCGTHFVKDGKKYVLQTKDLGRQARKAGIDWAARKLDY